MASIKALAQIRLTPAMSTVWPWSSWTRPERAQLQLPGHSAALRSNTRTGGSSFQIHAAEAALRWSRPMRQWLIAYGSDQRSSVGKLVSSSRPSPWETL
jgi:hypothetical protein